MNDIQPVSTMPVKGPQQAILGTPAYIWKTGTAIYLSKRQMVCVEAWLRKPNLEYVRGEMKRELGKAPSNSSIEWVLKIPCVKDYLEEKWRERAIASGWDKDHWLAVMTDHLSGKVRLASGDLYGMSMIAKVMGWDMPEKVNFNQQITFTQANGVA